MENRTISSVLIIIIFIALFVYFFLRYIFREEIFDPFSEKTRLVRYYACSMAICTRGCGNKILSEAGCSSKHGCLCLERDPGTKECKRWCQAICDENKWPDGTYCDENHYINITLRQTVNLKGAYGYICPEDCSWNTEINNIIYRLNQTESFPGRSDILWGIDWTSPDETNPNNDNKCTMRSTGLYHGYSGYTNTAWGFGLINEENAVNQIEGGGDIILDSIQAPELYSCVKSGFGNTFDWQRALRRGYYSCTFNGILKIWSFNKPSYPNGCADVSFRAAEISHGDFILWPVPDTKTIPIKQQDSFEIKITNNLGSNQPQKFTLSIQDDLITNGAGCAFDGQLKTTLTVADTDTQSATMKCNPNQFPPSGQDRYTVVITANPVDGGITHVTKVDVIVSDFTINITPNELKIANPGVSLVYAVGIDNRLGIPADFALSKITDLGVDCILPDSLHVENGEFNTVTMTCTPTSGGSHEVMVIASYSSTETIEHNATIEIYVPVCSVNSLNLKFLKSDTGTETTNVDSGHNFDINISGFEGCQGFNIDLYVSPGSYSPELYIGSCPVNPSGSGCRITKTAGTPGVYEFNATMVVNGIEHNASNFLTINKPSIDGKGSCIKCSGEWCSYHQDKFCQHFVSWPNNWEDCSNSCDPQTCTQDTGDESTSNCGTFSNICVVSGKSYYSPGPTDVPCLSPDTDKNNGGAKKTDNIVWRGSNLDGARNVLVQDDWGYGHKVGQTGGYYARFTQNDYCNGDNGNCDGTKELSGFTGLSGAKCVNTNKPHGMDTQWFCKLSDTLPLYTSWLYIKISDTDTSRPVYGIHIKEFVQDCPDSSQGLTYSVDVGIFLHNINSGWFEAVDDVPIPCSNFPGDGRAEMNFRPPNGQWAWNDIDAMLIVNKGSYKQSLDWLGHSNWGDWEFYVDYIGLLTKGADIPYCTEGNANDYYRTVDDGKTCYWGLNCPHPSTDSSGWSSGWVWQGSSPGIGPLGGEDAVVCDCSSGSCGNGYCAFKDKKGEWFCYYNVTCMTGGWNGNIDKCNVGEQCQNNGCVM